MDIAAVDDSDVTLGRVAFGVLAASGTAWWIGVAASDTIAHNTLGRWDPALTAVFDVPLFIGCSAVAAWRTSKSAARIATAWSILVAIALSWEALVNRLAGWGALLMALAAITALIAASTFETGSLPTKHFFRGPFAFRESPAASTAAHVRRSLLQLVVFWSVLLGVLPLVARWAERRARLDWSLLSFHGSTTTGAVIFLLASAMGLWSCLAMAIGGKGTPLPAMTASELVVRGPYRFVRNPMAVAGAAQTIGVGIMLQTWSVFVAAVGGAAFWHLVIRPVEEADLLDRFGASYEHYRRTTRCWVPKRTN